MRIVLKYTYVFHWPTVSTQPKTWYFLLSDNSYWVKKWSYHAAVLCACWLCQHESKIWIDQYMFRDDKLHLPFQLNAMRARVEMCSRIVVVVIMRVCACFANEFVFILCALCLCLLSLAAMCVVRDLNHVNLFMKVSPLVHKHNEMGRKHVTHTTKNGNAGRERELTHTHTHTITIHMKLNIFSMFRNSRSIYTVLE